MTHPTYRTFEPCRNWDVVRTWGRETNRSGQLPALEADGGRERRAIGDRSSGGPPSRSGAAAGYRFARWSAVRAGGRGTVLPVGRLYEPQPVAVRATAPARPGGVGCASGRFGPESGPCAAFPQAGAAVSPASLSLNTRAGSAVDVGYIKANQTYFESSRDVLRIQFPNRYRVGAL